MYGVVVGGGAGGVDRQTQRIQKFYNGQGFIQPPPNSKVPPPSQPRKFWYVPEVYKMTKVLEDGRENG